MTGRAELEQAVPVLLFTDRGFGQRNLVNTFLRLDSGFNEESLGWFDIIDEMEVEKEDESTCCLFPKAIMPCLEPPKKIQKFKNSTVEKKNISLV